MPCNYSVNSCKFFRFWKEPQCARQLSGHADLFHPLKLWTDSFCHRFFLPGLSGSDSSCFRQGRCCARKAKALCFFKRQAYPLPSRQFSGAEYGASAGRTKALPGKPGHARVLLRRLVFPAICRRRDAFLCLKGVNEMTDVVIAEFLRDRFQRPVGRHQQNPRLIDPLQLDVF